MGVIGYGLGVIGAGFGIGLAAFGATTAMARQPEVQGRLFTVRRHPHFVTTEKDEQS